jgi:hypothetical protein
MKEGNILDKIYGMLEKHERWVETLEPSGDDKAKLQHWDLILQQIERNLTMHEMMSNILQMRDGKHTPNLRPNGV